MAEDTSKYSETDKNHDLKFSKEQYDMLMRCSENNDMKEWNKWRLQNPNQDVLLEGADFSFSYLQKAQLNQLGRYDDQKEKWLEIKSRVYLKGAHFESAEMQSVNLSWADLENVCFRETRLNNARLRGARLKGVIAWDAYFQQTNLRDAILRNADLQGAYLEGAYISFAHLEGANFHLAHVDGSTLIWKCEANRKTNFSGVALDVAQIDPGTKQLLQYNIRLKSWEEWYPKHIFLRWPVRWFWSVSNYGLSTWRILGWFLMLSLFFASVYSNIACWYPEGIVSNLTVEPHLPLWHYFILCILRPIYFSVVTMTTLRFGDIYANVDSIWGHLLLTIQVILGYVLLGALVTRFAVLFTAGGPAGSYTDN